MKQWFTLPFLMNDEGWLFSLMIPLTSGATIRKPGVRENVQL
jgi:hypothetical protein